jgi:hypothetical protein
VGRGKRNWRVLPPVGEEIPEEDKGKKDSREERQLGFSKGVYVKSGNCRGLFVKQNFPLI